MKRNLIFVLGILLFFGFVLVSCSAQSNALVGRWFWEEEECYFTFFNDGTLIISDDDDWKTKYSWKITKGLINLKWIGDERETDFEGTWDFKISGSKLTINWEDEEPIILVKQKN